MKARRHEYILQAVKNGDIATQEQLLAYLHAEGIMATQATVSRDVKELGLIKSAKKDGKTYYECAQTAENVGKGHNYAVILSHAVLSVDGAGHTACVRCGPGMAQGVCAALDASPLHGVVGSLAGEDTIFLLCRSEADRVQVQAYVAALVNE